jgi:penicillin-binding protein 2
MEKGSKRQIVYLGLIAFVFIVYSVKLASIQLGEVPYKKMAINNALNKITLYPSRSNIFDRKGKLMVYSTQMYDLSSFPYEIKKLDTGLLCSILEIDLLTVRHLILDARIRAKKRQKNNAFNNSALFYANLSNKQFTLLRENIYRLPGFYIESRTDRQFATTSAPHALGYLGEADESLIELDDYNQPGDLVGITGIERYYEKQIRGIKGVKTVWQDRTYTERGVVKDTQFNFPSTAGPDVISSLDFDLQEYGRLLLNGKKGSIVAIEPSTGEVIAFINNPDYDPNTMVGRERAKTFKSLLRDEQKPLYNRAVKGVYPPGSTFKTVMALIAMQEGVLSPETTHGCAGGYRLGSIRVGCHPHGGPLDLRGSIRISCNSYYCQVFRDIIDNPKYGDVKLGYAALEKHLRSFGLGSQLNIDLLGESRGNIPSVAQLNRRHGDRWKSSTVISLSIGQGEILLTPLQICNVAAIIANRGWYYAPHLVKKIDGFKDTGWDRKYKIKKFTTINPTYFATIIDGMSDVTKPGGTANGTGITDIEICAKTGTAQNPHGKDHSIYMAFAPKDNPKIAIAVLVENGGFGATWAAPIANLMIEKYLKPGVETSKPAMEERLKTSVIK